MDLNGLIAQNQVIPFRNLPRCQDRIYPVPAKFFGALDKLLGIERRLSPNPPKRDVPVVDTRDDG